MHMQFTVAVLFSGTPPMDYWIGTWPSWIISLYLESIFIIWTAAGVYWYSSIDFIGGD